MPLIPKPLFKDWGCQIIHRDIIIGQDDGGAFSQIFLEALLGHYVGHDFLAGLSIDESSEIIYVDASFACHNDTCADA